MNKNKLFNSIFVFFMLVGVYHLQACTVLVDVSTSGQTQTSTTGQTTSVDLTSTGDLTGSSSGELELCGDCIQQSSEECDPCVYKEQFMSKCENVETAKCQLTFYPIPQLDCTNNWIGKPGCDQEEADLACKIFHRNAQSIATGFHIGQYIPTRGLFSSELVSKDGVELLSVPDAIYPKVFYFESNPYLVPTNTLEVENCKL